MPERSGEPIGPEPTERVERAALLQSWNVVTWLHWSYDPAAIQPLLPEALELDTFEGRAWVGLIPFLIENQRLPRTPAVPGLSTAQETHLRTYVTAPDGRHGSYFFYLENGNPVTVLGARAAVFLRYAWSRMSLRRRGTVVEYRGGRLVPPLARHEIEVEIGPPYAAEELTPRDHFLTAQWILFTTYGRRLGSLSVEHPPWPLRRARLRRIEDQLFEVAGVPPPDDEPVLHFSEGVDARLGFPRFVRPRPPTAP